VTGAEGLIWWDTPAVTVAALVVGGDLVDCPPDSRPVLDGLLTAAWPNQPAVDAWRELRRLGVRPNWIAAPPHWEVTRWWNQQWGTWHHATLRLQTNGWLWRVGVRLGDRETTLTFRGEADARAQVALWLGDPEQPYQWKRIG
jgi:hypothetical protein